MKRRLVLGVLVIFQLLCAGVFVLQIAGSVLGVSSQPIAWHLYELIEIGAALGLLLGVGFGAYAFRNTIRNAERAERALKRSIGFAFKIGFEYRKGAGSYIP